MGTKWSSTSISGYNASPPSDDGTKTEANKVKYSTITTNLTDPLNTALTTTLSRLNELFDEAPKARTGNYTTVSSDNARTIECDGTFDVTLLAPASAGTGYKVRVKNAGTGVITVVGTIDGVSNFTLTASEAATFEVNAAADEYIIVNDYAPLSAGMIIQSVPATPYTTRTDISVVIPADDSIPQITEGSEILSVAITPTSASSRLVVEWTGTGLIGSTGFGTAALFQDSTANALAAVCLGAAANTTLNLSGYHEQVAGGTSAITFRLRVGPSSGAANFYTNGAASGRLMGGVSAWRMRVTEIAA